jgi:prepilin-type N-terminal cleavage/methylation domain-containing protein
VNTVRKTIGGVSGRAKRSSASLAVAEPRTLALPRTAAAYSRGMTLIELILAVGLMAIVATVAFLGYDAAVRAWRSGTELSNSLHQGDYIMEQLVMGLRSAYWRAAPGYGFMMTDEGDGSTARDSIRWTKLGTALVGADAPYAGMPHAVEVSVRDVTDARGKTRTGLAVRSWRLDLQQTDFDIDKDVPAVLLSTRVVGFNCRTLDINQPAATVAGEKPELQWSDGWSTSNQMPAAVEITLFIQPPEEGKEPLEMKRIVRLPMADRSRGR